MIAYGGRVYYHNIVHTTYSWNINQQKCARYGLNGFIFKNKTKIKILKEKNPESPLEVAC